MSDIKTTEGPGVRAKETVATERLRGEAVCDRHYAELCRLLGDERVTKTLAPDGKPMSEDRVRELVASDMREWAEDGCGFWMWWEKDSGEFVGRGGLRWTEVEGQREPEICCALVPEFWNVGFATELAGFSRDVAFNDLGLDTAIGTALVHNSASRWVLEKIGMQYERDCQKNGQTYALYRIRR